MTEPNLVKRCRVCNGKALCFNFQGDLSCGPCRLFFYRNSAKFNQFRCKGNEVYCNIESGRSKYCKRCRLQKCFEIGMDLSQTVKKTAKRKPAPSQQQLLQSLLIHSVDPKSNSSPSSATPIQGLQLNAYESQLIAQAQSTVSSIFPDERTLPGVGVIIHPAESVANCTFYVPRIVQLCNRNAIFEQLANKQKLSILKDFVFEFISLRVAYIFDKKTEVVPIITDETFSQVKMVRFPVFSSFKTQKMMAENHRWKVMMNEEMENDAAIRDLLSMQLLFKPQPENTFPTELFCYQHSVYSYLLRRHLEAKYDDSKKAERKIARLLERIEEMTGAGKERFRQFLEELGSSVVPDLMRELFNLHVD